MPMVAVARALESVQLARVHAREGEKERERVSFKE